MSSNAFSGVENKTQLAQDAKDQASKIWEYVTSVRSVKKRDGRTEDFHAEKLERSIHAAFEAGGMENVFMLRRVTANGIARLVKKFDGIHVPSTDDIREAVIMTLIDTNLSHIAKRYMAARVDARQMSTEPAYGKGVRVRRFYTKPGVHPYDEIEWETRDAVIQNAKGDIVFEQKT